MSNSTGISAGSYRDLVMAIGGPFRPGDKLRLFFWQVAARAGVTPRTVRSAWEGDYVGPRALQRLREAAAAHATRNQAIDLAAQLEALAVGLREVDASRGGADGDALDETARSLREAAGLLRGVARSR